METIDARGTKPGDPPRESPEIFCPFGMSPEITMYCLKDSCGIWSKEYGKCSFTRGEEIITLMKTITRYK